MNLTRSHGSRADLVPGEYIAGDLVNDTPVVRCPKCGGLFDLPAALTVSAAGEVMPNVACPTATCGFREALTLEQFWEHP